MADIAFNEAQNNKISDEITPQPAGFIIFDNLTAFSKAVETATGLDLGVKSIAGLDTDSVQGLGAISTSQFQRIRWYTTKQLAFVIR